MVIDEAMRLYPPAHAISRTAIDEDRIGGARIPAGANMTVNIYVTHRNPNLWHEPERFDPERFAPAAVAQRHRFAYMPFGGGPRVCIGNAFAMMEVVLVTATVLRKFRLTPDGDPPAPEPGFTLRPVPGVRLKLERRADVH
jgi:cytochrome P450